MFIYCSINIGQVVFIFIMFHVLLTIILNSKCVHIISVFLCVHLFVGVLQDMFIIFFPQVCSYLRWCYPACVHIFASVLHGVFILFFLQGVFLSSLVFMSQFPRFVLDCLLLSLCSGSLYIILIDGHLI